MNTDRPQGESAFSLWWVLAGTVGLALGFVAAGTVAFPVFRLIVGGVLAWLLRQSAIQGPNPLQAAA
ncbi:MAG: hypothetical protein IIA51_06805 [Chloroflexi bacterium]|nr:hypothetical protein [Chloroflexota bacterium]MCH8877253.1 hypothetical protein [Chloroflexota bacterium]